MTRLFFLLAAIAFGAVLASPGAQSQNLVFNQPANISATALPTGGLSSGLGTPAVAVYTAYFTNTTASAVFCALYGSLPTIGTTATVGGQVEVPAGSTQPLYLGPTNGISKGYFTSGIFAGCSTTYLGSTGVALGVVGVAVTWL
jgi:hypothetical protein